MTYEINQIFEGEYPPEAAEFCNKNNLMIVEIDPINEVRRFQIKEAPKPDTDAIEIARLKSFLFDTDYVVIKIAEGSATPDEYSEIIEQRRKARERINELSN